MSATLTDHQRSDRQRQIDTYKLVRRELVKCKKMIDGAQVGVASDIYCAIRSAERELSQLLLDREINP